MCLDCFVFENLLIGVKCKEEKLEVLQLGSNSLLLFLQLQIFSYT